MDLSSLRRLAEQGIENFPPVKLADLSAWCWDFGEATGDARFLSLSRVIDLIVDLFESNSDQAPTDLIEQLNPLLRQSIPAILNAKTIEQGTLLSRQLREAVAYSIGNFPSFWQ
jgi:hypothetical protein